MTAPASPPLTPEEIAELRRLHEEATPAPWENDGSEIIQVEKPWGTIIGQETRGAAYMTYEALVFKATDRALVAAVRNALPRLLAAAERAEGLAGALVAVTTCSHRKWERTNDYEFVCGLCMTLARAALAAYRRRSAGDEGPKATKGGEE